MAERQSKSVKSLQGCGCLLILASPLGFVVGNQISGQRGDAAVTYCFLDMIALGFLVYFAGWLSSWWRHG